MKTQETIDLKWVGIDLHVHTPASKDYKGSSDLSEYLKLIKSANQFGASSLTGRTPTEKKSDRSPIGCVAFTDHNSVEGFRKYRQLVDETEKFAKAIGARDPGNALVQQVDKELETLRSVRVLMGTEIKADPGIHLLIIFAESVEPENVIAFLEEAYQSAYTTFQGDPAPATRWTLKQTLDRLEEIFAERAIVVFPHVDSSGGVYEDLKGFPQVRIAALTHPIVRALSFNRHDIRGKLQELFTHPEYQRNRPLTLIQSSDYHGADGTSIGQPRTDISVREGKATFKNLRECLRDPSKVKCSMDFVAEEYQNLVKDETVAKYTTEASSFRFRETDYDNIASTICGFLNANGGIVELEGNTAFLPEGQAPGTVVLDHLTSLLSGKVVPPFQPSVFRTFQFSPGKLRVLNLIIPSGRLHMASGSVFINGGGTTRVATPGEIEFVVSRNLHRRFGRRFERTLDFVSKESTLLAKLPHGIPLILACQDRISLSLPDSMKVVEISPASEKNREAEELVEDLDEQQAEQWPFGNPNGNTTLLLEPEPPRRKDHYLRFSTRRAEVTSELLDRCAWGKIEQPALIIQFRGYVGLVEPGHIISDMPAVLLQLDQDWQEHIYALSAWFKSSFFLWYCAVRLGQESPYIELQRRPYRLPVPRKENPDFWHRMDAHAKTLVAAENEFMIEVNRLNKKGTLDSEYSEKVRQRHNLQGNKISLAIDKEVYEFLALSNSDRRFIGQTLRDLKMTDFGLLDELNTAEPEM